MEMHPRPGFRDSDVLIPWDIENSQVPHGVSARLVGTEITRFVRNLGYTGTIHIFAIAANRDKVPTHIQHGLNRNGSLVHYFHRNYSHKNAADNLIMYRVRRWIKQRPHASATVLMISGDKDFGILIRDLANLGHNVLLAYPVMSVSATLFPLVHHGWPWRVVLGFSLMAVEETLWVGNLPPAATDAYLSSTFSQRYRSVDEAWIVRDVRGRSKRYGFVRFLDHFEKMKAQGESHGYMVVRGARFM